MPKLLLSYIKTLPFDFEAQIKAFIEAKKDHHLQPLGTPAPTDHPIVEASVRRLPEVPGKPDDFTADYEIVDDTPPPPIPPTLDERKAALVASVQAAEVAARGAVISPARQRLMHLDLAEVYKKPIEEHTDADKALLDSIAPLQLRMQAIQRHSVGLEIEIEDLTEATIDAWKATPFPEA